MRQITDTISTYDTETGTTQHETTIMLYTLDELSNDAKTRALHDWIDNREPDPYWFNDCYESEIWECVRDLEKSITGARVSWSYNRWYSCDFDCEYTYDDSYDPCYINHAKDNGYCYSMDMCDAWNKHTRKLNGLYYQYEHLDYLCWDVYNEWDSNAYQEAPQNASFFRRADALRDKVITLWYAELEAACDDVRDAIEILLRGEWDWYTGEEYARMEFEDESTQGGEWRSIDAAGRVYYSDNRRWYTVDGEEFEQSDINHECVSLARVS